MYLKTTSPHFFSFGYIKNSPNNYPVFTQIYDTKKPGFYKLITYPISYEVKDGIALLVLLDENQKKQQFVIHRETILNANIPHIIIPLTQTTKVSVSVQTKDPYQVTKIETDEIVQYKPIQSERFVSDIYSYYYSVKGQEYFFKGESHSYWELTYVDTGQLITNVDGKDFVLENQNLFIYFPKQFHQQKIKKSKACSYLTIMFDLNIHPRELFVLKNKVHKCSQSIHNLIKNFIKQSSYMEEHRLPYSRNLMVLYLEEIIIYLLQNNLNQKKHIIANANPVQAQFENETIDEINAFILKNMHKNLTVGDLSEHFALSRSSLQLLFKKHIGTPPKEYINNLRMKEAQKLIGLNEYTITEIAHTLGFSSIHYFSRKFKQHFGISPSEYSKSILTNNVKIKQ